MFARDILNELKHLIENYPVVTIVGPRQSGKTTLVRYAFPQKAYVNLEDPDLRNLAENDPRGFLQQYPEGVILDEIQRVPILLSYIQTIVDEKKLKGMFILTGSHQLELHQAISQSLAGRTALLTLLPMSLNELDAAGLTVSLDEVLIKGGYPRIYQDKLDPTKAYRNYFQTYVERDLRQLINVKDLTQFERFIRICAGRIGQMLNLEEIGGEVGLSSHTVKHWISMLEASFIVFRLHPYFENFGKRLIKSPKLFFTDVGLATYLLGIENVTQMSRDPLRGHLVENLVILELVKTRTNQGLDPQLYYYRDTQKNEVDVIYKQGNHLIPIEIKSSKTFNPDFLKRLRFFQDLTKKRSPKGYLVYAGDLEQQIHSIELLNFKHASKILKEPGQLASSSAPE
ncbi:MAG TPA: ATP-binding protein [Rhabdochlamydiaceae bacterium]|nr:ATP-binding protein [Rhabdochlamydiaceae bacterium]